VQDAGTHKFMVMFIDRTIDEGEDFVRVGLSCSQKRWVFFMLFFLVLFAVALLLPKSALVNHFSTSHHENILLSSFRCNSGCHRPEGNRLLLFYFTSSR
jgi:hypothetical protein